jgi:hypothetical protein
MERAIEMCELSDGYLRLLSYGSPPQPSPPQPTPDTWSPAYCRLMSHDVPIPPPAAPVMSRPPASAPTSFGTRKTKQRRTNEVARLVVSKIEDPDQLRELMQALPHNPLIRGLCGPGQGQNDKILSQLALDAQSDPVLKDSLSRSLAQADVSKRSIARTLNLSRYALSKPPDKPPKSPWRKGDRYYTQEEDTYVRDWIHLRVIPLNDLSDKATRQGPTGREEHQKFQDFLGSTQMHRDFSSRARASLPLVRHFSTQDQGAVSMVLVHGEA